MKKKIASISVDVPIKKAGNIIIQENVQFTVFQNGNEFSLVPQLAENELRIANLPTELNFTIDDGKPVSLRGKRDGNFHVIKDAFEQLQTLQLLVS